MCWCALKIKLYNNINCFYCCCSFILLNVDFFYCSVPECTLHTCIHYCVVLKNRWIVFFFSSSSVLLPVSWWANCNKLEITASNFLLMMIDKMDKIRNLLLVIYWKTKQVEVIVINNIYLSIFFFFAVARLKPWALSKWEQESKKKNEWTLNVSFFFSFSLGFTLSQCQLN